MKTLKTRLKERFDYDVSAIGTYTDQESEEFFQTLLYSSGLTSRVSVMENVKGSAKVKLLNVDFNLQDASSCTLEDDGTVIFDNETISTVRLGVQFKLCNEDLNGTWAQLLLAVGANRQDEEPPLEAVLTAFCIKKAQKMNQDLMFNGDTTSLDENLAFYDGYVKLWMNDADLVVAPRTGATISVSNAFENAISIYDNIPEEAHDNGINYEIIMSRANARHIINQVWNDKDFVAKIDFTNEGGELSFELPTTDVMVRSYPQLGTAANANYMFGVPYQFMIFGTDLEDDVRGFFVKYLEDDEVLRYGCKWRSGVTYVLPENFVRLATVAS